MKYVVHHGDQHGRQISAVPDHLTMSEFRSNPDRYQFEVGTITRGGTTHRNLAYQVEWCDGTRSAHQTLQDVRDECQRRAIMPEQKYHTPAHKSHCYDDQGRLECCCALRRDADQQETEQISRAEAEQLVNEYAVGATAQVLDTILSPPPVLVVGQTYTVDSIRQLAEDFGGAMIGFPDDE